MTTATTTTATQNPARTALIAALFTAANIALPQICHMATLGGPTWLPIYLLTLICAYRYGWKAGILTAIASPILNMAIFAMPAPAALPAILIKSTILALAAAYAGSHTKRPTLLTIAAVIATYQTLGTIAEYAYTGSLHTALQDLRIGTPGLIAQLIIAYAVLTAIHKKQKK